MRAGLYVRVSTEEQKKYGYSVDSQIEALTSYCHDNNIIIHDIYNDAGLSARKSYKKRHAMLKLLDDCKKGNIDVILITKLDRWFRSIADYYDVQRVLDACHIPWKAIWEDYNTETADGNLKVNIVLSVAQAEADKTSERIKAVNAYLRSQGRYVGSAPLGYVLKDGKLYKDICSCDGVKAFFEAYADSYSVNKSIDAGKEHGVNIYYRQARNMLNSPVYYGVAQEGTCEPYITKEQYQQNVRSVSLRTRKPVNHKNFYIFSGMVRCSYCGSLMYGQTIYHEYKGKEKKQINYICSKNRKKTPCIGASITEGKIEKFLLEYYDTMLSKYEIELESKPTDYEDVQPQINKLHSKLDRIGFRYEEGDISRDEYLSKRRVIKEELAELEKKKGQIYEAPEQLPEGWKAIYEELSQESRRAFWLEAGFKCIEVGDKKNRLRIVFN